jgi:hypothetical protein
VDADNVIIGGIVFQSNDAMEHHGVVAADGAPQVSHSRSHFCASLLFHISQFWHS